MQLALIGGIAVTVVIGLGAGWMLGAPKDGVVTSVRAAPGGFDVVTQSPLKPNPHLRTWQQVQDGMGPAPGPDQDHAQGWEARKKIRDRLTVAIDAVERDPCDPKVRAELSDAWVARGQAMADAGSTPEGDTQPFWRTRDDTDLDRGLQRLITEEIVTQDELTRAMLMTSPFARMQMSDARMPGEQALVLVKRCGQTPDAQTALRLRAQQNQARYGQPQRFQAR